MTPIPFRQFLRWVVEEYRRHSSIFGIPTAKFYHKNDAKTITVFGETCDTPLGPAAGPHTQLAQNIVASYLVGGRFFELKTVQKLDSLEIEKPCIDAEDEGYNTEWSTELSVPAAYDEYLKAWIILHLLHNSLSNSIEDQIHLIFNMSVGYDLEGIKTPKIDAFIEQLKDASASAKFDEYLSVLNDEAERGALGDFHCDPGRISPRISGSLTLSTMHGCPPEEIEAICRYMLEEKELNTFVKLNPTLLGFDAVRDILDKLGYTYIELSRDSFSRDLQYDDAIAMLKRLRKCAEDSGRGFGVKLSNTLGVKNTKHVLPGDEMYMSGRALFPLTINLAAKLAREFDGEVDISYSGGANVSNISEILATGIKPITLATDLLKPGGYLRLLQIAQALEREVDAWPARKGIDVAKLAALAEASLGNVSYAKKRRGTDSLKIASDLPLFDCYTAPCMTNCPIKQDIPEYIRLIREERYADALALIVSKNPLPHITGFICDHKCALKCTRWDYDEPVLIRDLKRFAAEKGCPGSEVGFRPAKSGAGVSGVAPPRAGQGFRASGLPRHSLGEAGCPGSGQTSNVQQPAPSAQALRGPTSNPCPAHAGVKSQIKPAIIGAGPSGLSAAYFLARAGFSVTVFDKEKKPGGAVQNVIPDFRLPQWAIDADIEFIRNAGVKFELGVDENFSVERLRAQGFKHVYIAIGAAKSRKITLAGDNENVHDAIDFLRRLKESGEPPKLGRSIVVVGGGNSAMDGARAALRIGGVERVTIVYRRTQEQMPADREEFDNAIKDGVVFRELLLPVGFSKDGELKCQVMKLGEIDASGRRRPVPVEGEFVNLHCDSLISAIGEVVETRFFEENGIAPADGRKVKVNPKTLETNIENVYAGGDALRGPSTVVEAIADGRAVADAIMAKERVKQPARPEIRLNIEQRVSDAMDAKGEIMSAAEEMNDEARRCLACDVVCDKCVEVCPNRANISVRTDSEKTAFSSIAQIVHIDAMCNECGNCETFCPYAGAPYKDKLTLFWTEEDFSNSENNGFVLISPGASPIFKVRLHSHVCTVTFAPDGTMEGVDAEEDASKNKKELMEAAAVIWSVHANFAHCLP